MAPRRRKNRSYTLSLIPADGRSAPVTLLKGPAALFVFCAVLVVFLTMAGTVYSLFRSPLASMLPDGVLPARQKQLVARQAGKVDSLAAEMEKMNAFSDRIERMLFQGGAHAVARQRGRGGSGALPGAAAVEREGGRGFAGRLVTGAVSQRFMPSDSHYGIDIASRQGEPVGAVADGTVIFSGWTTGSGYTLIVDHGGFTTFYKHCSRLLRKGGEQVKLGEVIALSGDTGGESRGPHLHFELWKNGIPVDPEAYLSF
ncbi:hypothetical protein CHL67_11615 [Prosthecochloris sp. GSB1]|uniref:murein hydrolase activator EnvC family protein n=1 Tax=Prosthecochloris sp. GSB1 TaxID=281093 RepID=UPI000B8CA11E|nr:M23 family metallopeptidase [Prosthecochloris sp. GSB1]ASQ91485.1 hypothetical protein CHL67_11615 [Prosthecochloris sp. GSB1]